MAETGIVCRKYKGEDLPRCAAMAAAVWPSAHVLVRPGEATRFFEAYVDLALAASSWTEVVSDQGGVAGFLFGRVESDFGLWLKIKARLGMIKILCKYLGGRYGRLLDPKGLLRAHEATEKKIKQLTKSMCGEVVLFVVDPQRQGKGIGRNLMNRFLDYARARGAHTVSLATDRESNWRFYEIYGFKRFATFEDDTLIFMKQNPPTSFIYTITLS